MNTPKIITDLESFDLESVIVEKEGTYKNLSNNYGEMHTYSHNVYTLGENGEKQDLYFELTDSNLKHLDRVMSKILSTTEK